MSNLSEHIRILLPQIRSLIVSARRAALRAVDTLQVAANFEIGQLIVEYEQSGEERAEYGRALLKELSAALTEEFGRGFSRSNLKYMRKFYLTYRDRAPIGQTVSGQLPQPKKSQTASGQSSLAELSHTESAKSELWSLSWSHYLFLMGIKKPDERSFYEIEAASEGWSLRELRRQFDSGLYERLALSRDKESILALAREGQIIEKPEQFLKNPYVLEFLNYYDRHVKIQAENPTVGIILCKKKKTALVELTLPEGNICLGVPVLPTTKGRASTEADRVGRGD